MRLTRCDACCLAGARSFAGDRDVLGPNSDADAYNISRGKAAAQLLRPHTLTVHRLTIPAVETKDAVSLSNHVPALEIMECHAIGLTLLHMPQRQPGPKPANLTISEGHIYFVRTARMIRVLASS